jgi:hypothetical protein
LWQTGRSCYEFELDADTQPEIHILALVPADPPHDRIMLAAEAGALGYVARDTNLSEFASAIEQVHQGEPWLLILDEMGYFPLDRMTAQFLFQLISRRYGRGSVILTSNKSYGEWGDIFADQVLAAAILDRLLHFSTTINIRGQSYRLREKRKAGVFTELTGFQEEGPTHQSNV